MRNLQIEVRQLRQDSQSQTAIAAQGGVILQPGHSGGSVNLSAQADQRSKQRDLVQRVLALNGRPVNINLGNATPLRLVQALVQNGMPRYVAGTVWIEANSGFAARPVWRGGDSAEIELAAIQTTRTANSLPSAAATSTTLLAPLGEWVTVAETDEVSAGSNSGLASGGQTGGRSAVTVQLRLSVR